MDNKKYQICFPQLSIDLDFQPFQVILILAVLLVVYGTAGCQKQNQGGGTSSSVSFKNDSENGGLLLPGDFEATVVADSIGHARHITVNDNGDLYVKLSVNPKGLVALRDENNDGKADVINTFGDYPGGGGGTGIAIYKNYLYFSTSEGVYRYKLTHGKLIPEGEVEVIFTYSFTRTWGGHTAKPIAFDNNGSMYIPFGSASDVCRKETRTPKSPGLDPCPELKHQAGIWKFDANKLGQTQEDGIRYATGIRSVTASDWDPVDNALYVVQHGRDHLVREDPDLYSPWKSAILPAEEFMRVTKGSNFGWPYCYYDQIKGKKVLNPEYGGDGNIVGRCSKFDDPLIGFPGHFAPNDLLFYTGNQFPNRYKNGAFIAFHGSSTRAGYPLAGYFIAFVPFRDGKPSGNWEVFANGFTGTDTLVNVSDAVYRPMGLATGPDGSLYISESVKGKIWKVKYKGNKENFGKAQLADMEKEKRTASNIRTPDKVDDFLLKKESEATIGKAGFQTYCAPCHQSNGQGSYPRWPSLAGSEWVTGSKSRLVSVIVNGLEGPIKVKGESYDSQMPAHDYLSDKEVASIVTYIRQNFGNDASVVTEEEVTKFRDTSTTNQSK